MRIGIIGGGAAGLMTAGQLAKNGHNVVVFEKREKVARKILITGKGRCNITNNCDVDTFLENIPRNPRFLYSAIRSITPKEMIEFFEENGLPTKTERGNRVFPKSDKAMDVVDMLLKYCQKHRVRFLHETVTDILTNDGQKIDGVKTGKGRYDFDAVVIATGGLSYPKTGSTGDGYKFAEKFGHTIIEPKPSLVGLNSSNPDVRTLQGLALKNVSVTLFEGNKPIYNDFGEMLFTHFGVSGPIILSSSAHMVRESSYKIEIDLKPALDIETLDKRILRDFEKNINKNFANSLDELLPRKIIPVIIERSGIDQYAKVHSITKKERQKLARIIKNFEVTVSGLANIDEAIITRGGINVKEVNPKNMESKKISGLYFAGEVLDVDAYTGGFNLQIAWSTGHLIGNSIK